MKLRSPTSNPTVTGSEITASSVSTASSDQTKFISSIDAVTTVPIL